MKQIFPSILPLFCAVALAMLSACGNSEPSNHTRQGGLWDQVFSQAMSDNPGKSE